MPCEYKKTREFSRLTVLKSPSKRFLLFTFRVCSCCRCVWCSATGKEIDGRGRNHSLRLLCENGNFAWGFRNFSKVFLFFFFPFFPTNWTRCLFGFWLPIISFVPIWSLFEAWSGGIFGSRGMSISIWQSFWLAKFEVYLERWNDEVRTYWTTFIRGCEILNSGW